MPSNSGLSVWWSTPARPDRYFSTGELERSDRYHRPIRQVAVLTIAAKVGLLVGACLLAGGPLQRVDWLQGGGGGPVFSAALLVGAALAAASLRIPAIATDAWFEYRFRHGERAAVRSAAGPEAGEDDETGFVPAPVLWFIATVVSISLAIFGVLFLLGALGYWLIDTGSDWSITFSVMVLAILAGAAVVERPFRQGLTRRERPIPADEQDQDGPGGFGRLAASFGLAGLGIYVTATQAAAAKGRTPVDDVPNACAIGLGANRRVVVTDALLRETKEVREFVVAHEFTHLSRRHLLVQSAVSATVYVLSLQLLGVLADSGRPWSWFGLSPTDPLGMPMVALILFGAGGVVAPLVAWLTRAQERIADAGAVAALGPLSAGEALQLHARTAADLDPPWWVRLYDQHPAPAERLEFLARHR